jgi:predicted AAA+ superfamily ATPase
MLDLIKNLIADFHERELPEKIVPRDLELPKAPGKIQSIIGPRRAGKTTYLYSLIQQERNRGGNAREQVYINFEDERFQFDTENLQQILDAYQQLYPETPLNRVSFYFDEIQVVPAWEKFLRRMQDTVTSKIYVTGSSAKLLSREIATQLRGRTLSSTLLPFSFRERLAYFGIDPEYLYSTTNRNRIVAHFDAYMNRGGYPEVMDVDEEAFVRIMQEYGDVLLYRDIIERHNLSNPHVVREFLLRLIAGNSKTVSVNKLYNDFRSRGISTSKDALYALLDYFIDAYAAFEVKRYDRSPARRERTLSKVYVNDTGYATAYRPAFSADSGQKLETLVFLQLYRDNRDVYYFTAGSRECDFVVTDRGQVTELIQACYTLTRENHGREINGLSAAMNATGLSRGLLLTKDSEDQIDTDAGVIHILPVWKWLLTGA